MADIVPFKAVRPSKNTLTILVLSPTKTTQKKNYKTR